MGIIEISSLEMQILQFVSQICAEERALGEDGWVGRPLEAAPDYNKAIDRLIGLGVFEVQNQSGDIWLRPTEAGESMLAQVQSAHAEKQ